MLNKHMALICCRTWSGPAWSPAQSLSSVLISIQSLLNEKPYHNEPGFHVVCPHLLLNMVPLPFIDPGVFCYHFIILMYCSTSSIRQY